jgi:4-amino-4-deoxy-L-arabinose transferase-like glycosyltransferase
VLCNSVFFSFGYKNLGNFAAVDEPLWLYSRIGKYFNNIADGELEKTAVSDKPGITVSIISGVGLLFEDPKTFKIQKFQGEIHNTNADTISHLFFVFRLPILVFLTLFLFVLFWLTQKTFGTPIALLNQALLSTAPILVGMAKIINPDSLLWAFSLAAFLSFLLFQKTKLFRLLVVTGIFFGLALLTKYVANILLIFFLLSIALEYLYTTKSKDELPDFFKSSFADLGVIFFFALATFYVLLPATWIEPSLLLSSTFLSQAFVKFAGLFLLLIALLLLEITYHQSRFLLTITPLVQKLRVPFLIAMSAIFFGSFAFVLWHTTTHQAIWNFSELLSSPKTVSGKSGMLGIFFSNIYVLLFSVKPFVILGVALLFFALLRILHSKKYTSLFLATFLTMLSILLYYLGSVLNGVASIIRYQIILYPLFILLAAIGYAFFISLFPKKYSDWLLGMILLVLLGSGITTLRGTPFPGSYASSLLPKDEVLDVKDMGPGSYEAAQFLNALPNAVNLTVWTDKSGLCNFFVGRCLSSPGRVTIQDPFIDYVVVSSTRAKRITNMTKNAVVKYPDALPLPSFYTSKAPTEAVYTLHINDRTNHTVTIYPYVSPNRQKALDEKGAIEEQYLKGFSDTNVQNQEEDEE